MIEVNVQYLPHYNLPQWGEFNFKFDGDAGFDLRAALPNEIFISPPRQITKLIENNPAPYDRMPLVDIDMTVIPTGVKIELPHGYELQVRPRSGLAFKEGIFCHFGTIDSTYRGEIKVLVYNLSLKPFSVKPGDRIAQAVVNQLPKILLRRVEYVKGTDRGEGGFGHTGKD